MKEIVLWVLMCVVPLMQGCASGPGPCEGPSPSSKDLDACMNSKVRLPETSNVPNRH